MVKCNRCNDNGFIPYTGILNQWQGEGHAVIHTGIHEIPCPECKPVENREELTRLYHKALERQYREETK